ncbi:MAG: AAA family ATPase [Candidatus Binatia bacterium]
MENTSSLIRNEAENVVTINGVRVLLAEPVNYQCAEIFQGRDELFDKCRIAWELASEHTYALPPSFGLYGNPGVGKSEIVYQLVKQLDRKLYVIQGHHDLTPENLSVLVVPNSNPSRTRTEPFVIQASPLVSALLTGEAFYFDQIERTPVRTLSVLSSVLDQRTAIYSSVLSTWIEAQSDEARRNFRFCCSISTDSPKGKLPPYLQDRIGPLFAVTPLDYEEMKQFRNWPLTPSSEGLARIDEKFPQYEKKTIVQNHLDSIKKALGKIKNILSENAKVCLDRAWDLREDGQEKEALAQFEKAYSLNPNDVEILNDYADFLTEVRCKYDKAEELCRRGLRIDDSYGYLWATMGDIYSGKREVNRARHYYQYVLERYSDDTFLLTHCKNHLKGLEGE